MTRPPNFDLSTRLDSDGAVDTCTKVRPPAAPDVARLLGLLLLDGPSLGVAYPVKTVNGSKLVASITGHYRSLLLKSSDLASPGQA